MWIGTRGRTRQLGEVELGGWDMQLAWRNPPLEFLEKEITPLAEWAIWHAGTTPCLALRETQTEDLGDSVRIRLVVENTGWLPTNVTQAAVKGQMCRGVRFEIACEGDSTVVTERPEWLVAGTVRHQGPQLDGWSGDAFGGLWMARGRYFGPDLLRVGGEEGRELYGDGAARPGGPGFGDGSGLGFPTRLLGEFRV